jgi:hypothetical protein
MATYYIQQKATVWNQVLVEADSPEEAYELGLEALSNGEGYEAEDTWEWQDETCLLDADGDVIELEEGDD